MEYLLGLLGLLVGGVIYQYIRGKGLEALLKNSDTKAEVQKEEGKKLQNDSLLKAEELARELLKQSAEDKKKNDVKPGDFN